MALAAGVLLVVVIVLAVGPLLGRPRSETEAERLREQEGGG